MAAGATGIESRLSPLRGRLAASRAAEDLQAGLAAGAAAALVLALLRWTDLAPVPIAAAAAAGCITALLFPAVGVLARRTTALRVACLVDERLGLAERTATALSLEIGEAAGTPLSPLVAEDALLALDRVSAERVRRAFRPRLRPAPLAAALPCAFLAGMLLHAEPRHPETAKPKDPAAAYRESKEKEEAAKAARRVQEAAKAAEENADPKHVALVAAAAEVRRMAEEQLRKSPPRAEAMAAFQKMGEVSRERQELLAGVDPAKLKAWKAEGNLSKIDQDLQKLLGKLLSADLSALNSQLRSLDSALKGLEGAGEMSAESIESLKQQLEALADALEKSDGALGDRKGLKKALGNMGDPALLREMAERLSKLMETLRKQGWKGCKNPAGLNPAGMGDSDPGEFPGYTDEELAAMIEKLKELQELADLGKLAFCQNCGLTGGT
jgi:hypothetical protein